MYTKYFGLQEKPFEITPDPKFLYLSAKHKEALAHLLYSVNESKGFTVVTGEVGTGKTVLLRTLLDRMDGETRTAFLFNPKLNSNDFFRSICEDLELNITGGSKAEYLSHLQSYLLDSFAQKKKVVLIIDEAHTLGGELLEEVRLLTNLETPERKLLQVILLGQPELDEILEKPEFRPLKQRISVRYRLTPLSWDETKAYVKKRLKAAGARNLYLFTPKALKTIYRYSKGIPRLINVVCDNALLNGYASDKRVIGRSIVQEVIDDLEGGAFRKRERQFTYIVVTASVLFVCALLLWWGKVPFAGEGVGAAWAAVRKIPELIGKLF
jgi:general secretion pathway protein A